MVVIRAHPQLMRAELVWQIAMAKCRGGCLGAGEAK